MNILILGCGRVGGEIARLLVANSCEVTVVDTSRAKLMELQSDNDLRTVQGSAADPQTLENAGGDDADMVIAVTALDEVNLVACKLCSLLFHTPTKIARIRSALYDDARINGRDGFDIDMLFCPEQIIADNISESIRHPGCLSVLKIAGGRAVLASFAVASKAVMAGKTVGDLRSQLPDADFRAVSVYRDYKTVKPKAETRLFVGDELSIVAAPEYLDSITPLLAGEHFARRVMIAGGGNVGLRVAAAIEDVCQVKIMDMDRERCRFLSQELDNALVLKGRATDERLLKSEAIGETDIYCGLTNDDEENVLSAILAKRLGAKKTITLANRETYADILRRQLDVVVSPSQLTIGTVLARIRRGKVDAVHSLHHGSGEAIEAVISGSSKTSEVVGRAMADIPWPPETTPGAVVRGGKLLIAHDDVVVEDQDLLVVFATGQNAVRRLEKLLQVSVSYI
ncbi:MAG: Trk system potassium transporter TrkA [Gammaproteobacteria bacterium]